MKNCLKKVLDWIKKHPDLSYNIAAGVAMGATCLGTYIAYKGYLDKALELEDKRMREVYDLDTND